MKISYNVNKSVGRNGRIDIFFERRPSKDVIQLLKVNGWCWHKKDHCWYNYYSSDNLLFAQHMSRKSTGIYNGPLIYRYDSYSSSQINTQNKSKNDVKVINYNDFVILTNVFKCAKEGHHIEQIKAVTKAVNCLGEDVTISFRAGYCLECNKYYIMNDDYKAKKQGFALLCRVFKNEKNYEQWKKYGGSTNFSQELAQESPLKQFGYSVSKADDLSDEQRHKILEVVISKGILTPDAVKSYLRFFIEMHPNNSDAIGLWQSDSAYVSEHTNGGRTVWINSIK